VAYRVLVVDDSPAMRSFIRRILNLSGFAVSEFVEAANGLDALEILQARSVDVVLTDINMPRMNGEELVRQLDQDHKLRTLPVVVVSGDSSEVRVKRLMEIGARGYLSKPFSPERLRTELDRVLGARA